MSSNRTILSTTRRDFLRLSALGAAGLALLAPVGAAAGTTDNPGADPQSRPSDPYAPFRVGLQSYSLRHFGLDDALAKTQALGLAYWEAYPEHMPITDDPKMIAEYKNKLNAHDIRLLAYGVVDFSKDEADARRKFAFAKAMNVPVLSARPQPDSFDLLDKLVAEYKIDIAIHNHGPGDDLYDNFDKTLKAIAGHNPRIGGCDDTGHFLRSNISPVAAAGQFGKRLYDVHLKAVKDGPNGTKEFTEIGVTGSLLDTLGLFQTLKKLQYRHLIAIEYEEHEDDPIPYIQQCLEATRRYLATMRGPGILSGNG
jgi:sugar phosphate isomerase/epimerase